MKQTAIAAAVFLTCVGLACLPSQARAGDYFTDFESGAGAEWSLPTTDSSVPAFTSFAGRYGNDTLSLSLPSEAGRSYTLTFDLYVIDSWDGSSPKGPDHFKVSVDGNQEFDHTFVNYNWDIDSRYQDYPGDPVFPRTDLGFSVHDDAIYRNIAIDFTASSSQIQIQFQGSGLQGLEDESWGIDNVAVTPEPATMGMLALGGLALLRKRRKG